MPELLSGTQISEVLEGLSALKIKNEYDIAIEGTNLQIANASKNFKKIADELTPLMEKAAKEKQWGELTKLTKSLLSAIDAAEKEVKDTKDTIATDAIGSVFAGITHLKGKLANLYKKMAGKPFTTLEHALNKSDTKNTYKADTLSSLRQLRGLGIAMLNLSRDMNNHAFESLLEVGIEATLTAAERHSLPVSSFGIPDKRAYPLHDESHVRNAIRYFTYGKNFSKEEKTLLAKNILKKAKKFGIDVSPRSPIWKFAGETPPAEKATA
jgi:hypothetical protein